MAVRLNALEQRLGDIAGEFRRLVEALNLIVDLDRKIFQTSIELPDVLTEMLNGLIRLTQAKHAQILLRRGSTLRIVNSTQDSDVGVEFPVESCVCGVAVRQARSISSGDVAKDFPDLYQWVLGRSADQSMCSEVAVPIFASGPDRIIAGVLNVESPQPNAFSIHDVEMIEQFAVQAAAAIHNAHIHKGIRLTLELAQLLQASTQKPNDVLREGLQRLAAYFHQQVEVQFLTLDATKEILTIRSSTVSDTEGLQVLVGDSFSGLVVDQGKAVRSNDVRNDYPARFKDTFGDTGHTQSESELAVPITEDGHITGVLNIESPEKGAFSPYDEYVLSLVALNTSVWHRLQQPNRTRALEAMITVGDIAQNLTHIIRNELFPVGVIADRLGSIARGLAPEVSNEIDSEIRRLQAVLSTVDTRMTELDTRYRRATERTARMNLNRTFIEVVSALVTRQEITVQYELDDSLPDVDISPAIWDVLWNLVSNAQASVDEGKQGMLTVGTRAIQGRYTKRLEAFDLWVSDTGRGIPEEEQTKIFDLGDTSKEKGRGGFGMWWLKTFVERWDGEIKLKSNVGRGTTVSVRFPFKAPSHVIGVPSE